MDKFDRAQIKRWFLILSAIILTLIVVWTTTYKTPAALSFFKSRRQFDVSTSYSRSKEGLIFFFFNFVLYNSFQMIEHTRVLFQVNVTTVLGDGSPTTKPDRFTPASNVSDGYHR